MPLIFSQAKLRDVWHERLDNQLAPFRPIDRLRGYDLPFRPSPLADTWEVIDNSMVVPIPRRIAAGGTQGPAHIDYPLTWQTILDTVRQP
jgi:hypothetical protein